MTPVSRGYFFGETVRSRKVGGINLSENLHPTPEVIPRHSHERPYFYYVLRGASRERFEGRSRTATSQSVLFQPAGLEHENEWLSSGSCLHVELDPQLGNRALEAGLNLEKPFEFDPGLATSLAIRIHAEMQASDLASGLCIEGLVMEIVAAACRHWADDPLSRPPKWLMRVRDLLYDRHGEAISLQAMADEVGVHPSYLSTSFRRYFSCTVGEFLRRVRVERAAELIRNSKVPLGDVALKTGFADQSHLCRSFQRAFGVSPGEYRRTSR